MIDSLFWMMGCSMNAKDAQNHYIRNVSRKNAARLVCMALSLLLALIVSFVIPEIQSAKRARINQCAEQLNPAELMVDVTYPSMAFNDELHALQDQGVTVERVSVSPVYYEHRGNKVLTYLMSGYPQLDDDDAVISRSFADAWGLHVGDQITFEGVDTTWTVSSIEEISAEVTRDADVAGYVKVKSMDKQLPLSGTLLFLTGSMSESKLEDDLKTVENGYTYETHTNRVQQLYNDLDRETATLSVINVIGFVLSLCVLTSSLYVIVIDAAEDLKHMMLAGISRRIAYHAMVRATAPAVYFPLIAAFILSFPITLALANFQGVILSLDILVSLSMSSFIPILLVNIFVLFIFHRLILRVVYRIDLIPQRAKKKHWVGIGTISILVVCLLLSFFLFTLILQSGQSVSVCLVVLLSMVAMALMLLLIVWLLSRLSVWHRWPSLLLALGFIRKNRLAFVLQITNLALLAVILLVGFTLGSNLRDSLDKHTSQVLPYTYIMRSTSPAELASTLEHQDTIKSYSELTIQQATVSDAPNARIQSLRLLSNVDGEKPQFKITQGENFTDANSNDVLVSERLAGANDLRVGSTLAVQTSSGSYESFIVRGLYDSGGINDNWVLLNMPQEGSNQIFLVQSDDPQFLSNLHGVYVADVSIVGEYLLRQANNFLASFRMLFFLVLASSVLFNINISLMIEQGNSKEYAILRAVGVWSTYGPSQWKARTIAVIVLSFGFSLAFYTILSNFIMQSITGHNTNVDLIPILLAVFINILIAATSIFALRHKDPEEEVMQLKST